MNQEGSQSSLRTDEWHLIARHLSMRDLCRAMQVSRAWHYVFVDDRAWLAQRERVCARFPALAELFTRGRRKMRQHTSKSSMKSNANKKRKTAWIMPRKGIWYVCKRWLSMGFEFKGFRWLLRTGTFNELVYAIARTHVPHDERIVQCKRDRDGQNTRIKLDYAHHRRVTIGVPPIARAMWVCTPHSYTRHLYCWPLDDLMPDITTESLPSVFFKGWRAFILQDATFVPWWSELFVNLTSGREPQIVDVPHVQVVPV
jgi:hypothetical protein